MNRELENPLSPWSADPPPEPPPQTDTNTKGDRSTKVKPKK